MGDERWSEPLIFDEYPGLRSLPWMRIGNFPTPVQECKPLAKKLGMGRFFIKRDDLTNAVYGGNKVRKLEFLLPDAAAKKHKSLLTIGGIGSNHLLATTIHGDAQGFKTIGCVVPQPVTPHVKKNMLLYQHFGTELHLAANDAAVPGTCLSIMIMKSLAGDPPYFIPVGGSSPLGVIGYVEAAFELRKQVEDGLLPEPDYIFVASGSSGTAAGLNIGCRAAKLKTKVISVQVADLATGFILAQLATLTSGKLHFADSSFPMTIFLPSDLDHRTEFFGGQYGKLTPEGNEAADMITDCAGLKLEGVYTGKAAAALISAARSGALDGKNVVYWHTFNSVDLSATAAQHSYKELPRKFHKFFESPEHKI